MQAEIKGTTMPVLEVTVQPGEQLVSTHGELSWMTANMQMSQTTGRRRPHAGPPARDGRRRYLPDPL